MSSRTYLSIGDVLTLLREEFPDVTISKIRFLESQGLVNPERSPSGYRKFFDHDVERLRWVLRQQREHFLPLKVIRDRLADGDLDEGPPGGPTEPAVVGAVEDGAEERAQDPAAETNDNGKTSASESVRTSAPGVTGRSGSLAGDTPEKASEHSGASERSSSADDAMARILADASRRKGRLPDAAPSAASAAQGAGTESESAAAGGEHDEGELVEASPGARTPARSRRGGVSAVGPADTGPGTQGGSAGAPVPAHMPSSEGRRHGGGSGASRSKATRMGGDEAEPAANAAATQSRPGAGLPGTVVTGASLTAEELCTASGLSPAELAELEGFGLIDVIPVAGMRTYDESALTVANLATSFRAFGIEPRHLRQYRNAADREMGLIEQVVIPLLRQRNPESRQRAVDAAEQLAALGQSMRASLVRTALRRHLGG